MKGGFGRLFSSMQFNNLDRQKYISYLAIYTAFAITIFVVETFIPKPFPFLKLGLANIVTLLLLSTNNIKEAVLIAYCKTIIGGFATGTLFSPTTVLSLSGTSLSLLIMILLLKSKFNFSILGLSIAGAVCHNFGQIAAVRFILIKENSIFYLTPLLIVTGIVTGIITGYIAFLVIKELEKIENEKKLSKSKREI